MVCGQYGDDAVAWGREMIVLGLGATILVASALVAVKILLDIEGERHAATQYPF
jgi:hypothetical protein